MNTGTFNWRRFCSLSTTSVLALGLGLSGSAMTADGLAKGSALGIIHGTGPLSDDYSHPLGDKRRALRGKALEARLNGNAPGRTYRLASGQYVELERESEDSIFTILADYSDFPRNSIAEPDRAVDNSTAWTADFTREHFMDLMFSEEPGAVSVRNFYTELSSGRYSVNGDVTEWVAAPGTAASYDDDLGGQAVWQLLIDSGQGWYNDQLALGMSGDDINDYLSQFDVWDRYDYDGDGNFDEPDGYIDHFQSVHAGEGEEAGGGALGGTAIWSHRWYAYFNLIDAEGPGDNLGGGVQIGQSNYWIGDYTIEPENGGVGVFAHEFGHDLGLPDLYATQGGANSTGFWTLMSSGSWLSDGTTDIGSRPGHMGAWEKFQLGWLNYVAAFPDDPKSTHTLGPAHHNTENAQAIFMVLPDKQVTNSIATPYAGDYFYYSGADNDLMNAMIKFTDLAPGTTLTAKVNMDIEADWDYAYVIISTDNGDNYVTVENNLSTNDDPFGQNLGNGITGSSGGAWIDLSVDLSAYEGAVVLGFYYVTDGAVVAPGFMIDDIFIGADGPDGAEADAGWIFAGYRVTTGEESQSFFNAYVAEYRQYGGYDLGLSEGPYNFGFLDNAALGNWVEHFPYQDGLLISYWDTSYSDNNTPQHPGGGLILPIDAHPVPTIAPDGGNWRPRVQSYDATFSLGRTDAMTLHQNSVPSEFPSLPKEPKFYDRNSYYDPSNPWSSVIVPSTGTKLRIMSDDGETMQVEVRPGKSPRIR